MSEATQPTFLRRKFGVKLRRMREKAGFTLEQAANRLDKTRSALHRLETGATRADSHVLRTMMDLYDHYDRALLEEVREVNKTPWYRAFGFKDGGYLDLEPEASGLSQFLLIDIPGLLQTEAYMRALFRTRHQSEQAEAATRARLFRQQRLISEERPLQLHTIVCEAALKRGFGPSAFMAEQLRHLITMSALPTVTLQVMPTTGAVYLPTAPFTLLTYPDPTDPDLLYLENPIGHVVIEDQTEVQKARLQLDQLQRTALDPGDSVAYIEELLT